MAPPRRRKVGSFRIDAALAAMRPMGFHDSDVQKCVKHLLKVYGAGAEGWYFIEECSYKLLIETLIEDGHGVPGLESAGNLLTDGAGSSGGNGSGASREQYFEDQGAGRNSCPTEIMHITTENHSQDYTQLAEAKSELVCTPISVPMPMDLVGAKTNPELEFVPVSVPVPVDHVDAKITKSELDSATMSVATPMDHVAAKTIKSDQDFSPFSVAMPMHPVAAKRIRKPCYGWISDDDDDDDDFILLRPASTAANSG